MESKTAPPCDALRTARAGSPRRRTPSPAPARRAKEFVLAERWREYKHSGDQRARDDLVLAYAPIVKYVAGRVASRLPQHVEAADLISDGFRGLLAAVERFEPFRGVSFEVYADRRINGAILDGMRASDWVPRQVRDEARGIERATAALATSLRRLPREGELATALSLTRAQLNASLLRVSDARLLALDGPWGAAAVDGEQRTLLDTLADDEATDPAASAQHNDRQRAIHAAVGMLPAREQTILGLYYQQELTLTEIAEVLGISKSRVSQLHARAALELRTLLAPADQQAA
ncbi:MAG TPA: FliA/WhiG family RNA polymerase sigma factor [Conexibacter sp.]|nr:FliA/WhiG family RNA polymerase sigma factor [Conexibacter sp.]